MMSKICPRCVAFGAAAEPPCCLPQEMVRVAAAGIPREFGSLSSFLKTVDASQDRYGLKSGYVNNRLDIAVEFPNAKPDCEALLHFSDDRDCVLTYSSFLEFAQARDKTPSA